MSPKQQKKHPLAPRRGGNPANLEKSRERTKQHLRRGGKQPRALTLPEIEYCAHRARGVSMADAARWAGIKPGGIHKLEHRDSTREAIERISKDYEKSTVERVDRLRAELTEFIFAEFQSRLRRMKTHRFKGDDSVVRALSTGFKAIGVIEPAKVTAQANAAAKAETNNQLYAKRLYLPDWRRETIDRLEREGVKPQ